MSAEQLQTIELPAHFVQVQLNGLKTLVGNHQQDNHRVQFDASEVERIDGAAVQFLVVLSQLQSQAGEQGALVVNANETMTNAFNDMGVVELIKFDIDNSAQAAAA